MKTEIDIWIKYFGLPCVSVEINPHYLNEVKTFKIMSTLLSFERHENTPLREGLRKYLHTLGIEPQMSLSLVRCSRDLRCYWLPEHRVTNNLNLNLNGILCEPLFNPSSLHSSRREKIPSWIRIETKFPIVNLVNLLEPWAGEKINYYD